MAIKINGVTVIDDSQNFTSTGTISATGNITSAGNIVTTGTIVGNVQTTGPVSTTGNITAGNISATGNIAGSFFIGNGSQLTGIDATQIQSGTSNVKVVSSGGNVTASVGGTSNVLVIASSGTVTTGSASVTGGVTAASVAGGVITGTLTSVSGGVTAASVAGGVITGTSLSTSGTVTGGNLATGGTASAGGNITGANLLTGGLISATGNITGANIVVATNIYDASVMTIVTGAGNINIQPAGNLVLNSKNINNVANPAQDQDAATKIYVDNAVSTSISYHQPVVAASTTTMATTTGGTITYNNGTNGVGATLTTTGSFNLIDTANVQTLGTRILVKDEGNAVFNGVYTWSNATTITRSTDTDTYGAGNVNALGLNDYFFVSSGNVNKGSAYVVSAPTGTITFGTSNISFAQFSSSQTYTANTSAGISIAGTVINAKVDGTTTAFDGGGNISVKASATLTTPNIGAATGTSLSVTGAVTAASTVGGVITGSSVSVTGAVTAGADISLTGNIVDTGALTISTSSNGNIALSPNGTGVIVANKDIVNGQANATGNIGSATGYFNTVFAKATSAQYADLAEKYTADADYAPGTVVMFGGTEEVTICNNVGCSRVAGVVSTNPSYRMNDGLVSEHTAMVALTGRVPTSVTGTVRKGDLMVSAGNGVAMASSSPLIGTVIGKALADSDGDAVIEVVVGRV